MTLIKAANRDAHRAARQILASIPSAAASVGGRRASAKAGVDPRVFSDKAGVMRHAGAPDKAGVRDTKASDKAFVVRHLNVRDKAKARHVSVSNKVHPDRDKTSGNTRKAKAKGTGSAVIRKAHTGLKRRVVKPAKTAPTSSTTAVKA